MLEATTAGETSDRRFFHLGCCRPQTRILAGVIGLALVLTEGPMAQGSSVVK